MSNLQELSRNDWLRLSAEDADRMAALIVREWPAHSQADCVQNGMDYSLVLRQKLWPVVAAHIRSLRATEQTAAPVLTDDEYAVPRVGKVRGMASFSRRLVNYLQRTARCSLKLPGAGPKVFVPFPHRRWKKTLNAIIDSGSCLQWGNPVRYALAPRFSEKRSAEFSQQLVASLAKTLARWSIGLTDDECNALEQDLHHSQGLASAAISDIRNRKASLLLTNTAGTSPTIEYVLTAKNEGVPTCGLQYGLDCDRYVYDETVCDHVAVWGSSRQQRYENTGHSDRLLHRTGNPELDHATLPSSLNCNGNYWLWVTRPHLPFRCKLPSHSPEDGIAILVSLLAQLARTPYQRLMIKPHPNDYSALYQKLIQQHDAADRVRICHAPLGRLVPDANLVITEDTSAGIDCLCFGKRVVQAHFGQSPPVLDFNHRLPGSLARNSEELAQAIESTLRVTARCSAYLDGCHDMVIQHYGQLDGRGGERLSSLIGRLAQPEKS